jgi:hypothetical protein
MSDVPTKTIEFKLVIETGAGGDADMMRVEELVGLHFQDLLYDETFSEALQPKEFISSTVTLLDKQIG